MLALAALYAAAGAEAAVWYVNTSSGGKLDGRTWNTAFHAVQEGLDAAAPGDEVWVAAGTYAEHITLRNGVAVYGGFAGEETDRSARSVSTAPTILDGGASDGVPGSVVTAGEDVVLPATIDGFTIRNGNGNLHGNSLAGGGIDCWNANVIISGNTVSGNTVRNIGGGIACVASTMVLRDNTISGNKAVFGAGVYCDFLSDISITGNSVIGNTTSPGGTGGGMDIANSAGFVGNNTVSGNMAPDDGFGHYGLGGGIFCGISDVLIERNRVSGNQAYAGAGLFVEDGPVVEGNSVLDNAATYSGGGLYVRRPSFIVSNIVAGNDADYSGGGLTVTLGTPTIANNTVVDNTAGVKGGAMRLVDGAPLLANNIVTLNGSGLDAGAAATVTLTANNILENGSADFSGLPDPTNTDGNMAADPRFLDRAAGNYRLLAGSPCLNTGTDATVTASQEDADARPRIIGDHVDIGAYEYGEIDPYTVGEALAALRTAAGLDAPTMPRIVRLNAEQEGGSLEVIDLADAIRILRKALTVDTNP